MVSAAGMPSMCVGLSAHTVSLDRCLSPRCAYLPASATSATSATFCRYLGAITAPSSVSYPVPNPPSLSPSSPCLAPSPHLTATTSKTPLTPALRNTTPSELITIDEDYASRVAERKRLISTVGRGVHGVIPDGRGAAAVRELYTYLLRDHLPRRFPTLFILSPDSRTVTNHTTGRTLPTSLPATTSAEEEDAVAEQGLRDLAETVEEDLFFLQKTGETHQCVAFACCFPSGFDPSDKLGKGLGAIHAPVPSYERIGPSMERFFSKMEVGKPVRRLNVSPKQLRPKAVAVACGCSSCASCGWLLTTVVGADS